MIKVPGGRKTKSMADETYLISHRLMNRRRTIFESFALETWSVGVRDLERHPTQQVIFYKDNSKIL